MRLPTFSELEKDEKELAVYHLPADGRYLITGPPGSGKTVMALYRAQRLKLAGARRHMRLVVYGKALSQYISHAAKELGVDGHTFTWHSWFWKYHKWLTGRQPATTAPFEVDWLKTVPVFHQKVSNGYRLRHLILDEAQDLSPHFFIVLNQMAENYMIFADINQQIMHNKHTTLGQFRAMLGDDVSELRLTKNYRNTHEIAAVSAKFYADQETGMPDPPTRTGPKPIALRCTSVADAANYIARYARSRADQSIGVVVNSTFERTLYFRELATLLGDRVQSYGSGEPGSLDFDSNKITIVCLQSVKGLEFDAVYLHLMYPDPLASVHKMQLYVATSRPREYLALIYLGEPAAWITGLGDLVRQTSTSPTSTSDSPGSI